MHKVLYDNSCEFCRRVKYILSKFDTFNFFIWIPNKEYNFDENDFKIEKDIIEKSILLITSSKKNYLEFYACRYIMIHIPVFWPILPLFFVPFISSFLGNRIYKRVARKRYCKS